jgi:hypothetical protein
VAAVIAVIALMAAVAVWLLLSDGADAGPPGQPQSAGAAPSEATSEAPASERPSETASEPQSTATEETRAERLARLRKTDAFVEFANWDRARTAPNYERAVGAFSWYDERRDSHVGFTNAKRLWNQIAPPVRDDLLLTGPEYRGPILDDRVRGGITGSYERRGEESQLIAFLAPFKDVNGVPMGRVNAVLIDVSDQQGDEAYARGRLLARMKPFTVAPEDYTTNADLAERGISPRLRSWAQEHGG